MLRYRIFWRAARALMHPVSVAAILLLLFNDHWLRVWHPSWLTGKLGDFTWLVFAPFLCLMLIVWLMPSSVARRGGILAFSFIGVWFATAKTIPFVHSLTTSISGALQGSPSTLLLDPTDLLTLPALLIGWWVWRRTPDEAPPEIEKPSIMWVLFGLALFGTLASDEGTRYISGISRICRVEDQLVAYTYGSSYNQPYVNNGYAYSDDNGATWQFFPSDVTPPPEDDAEACTTPSPITDPQNPQARVRWEPGVSIEQSTDGGQTWAMIHDLEVYEQEVRIRINTLTGNEYLFIEDDPEPHNGLIDPASGVMVFAMGIDGVLRYGVDGEWDWITVGEFELAIPGADFPLFEVIFFEFWLALALLLLIIVHATAYVRDAGDFRRFLLMVGRWSWLILIIFYLTPYQLQDKYEIGFISLVLSVILALPLSIGALWDIVYNYPRKFPLIFFTALGVAVVFIAPYILWSYGIIGFHRTASIIALIGTFCGVFGAERLLKQRLPVLGPPQAERLVAVPVPNYPPDHELWTDEPE